MADHFFSFLPLQRASREMPFTAITLNLMPGMSPFDLPFLPNPAISTSSFSLRQFRHPSMGTKAAIFLPFFLSITLTPFLMAELGCLDSTPIFSTTSPLAIQLPWKTPLNLEASILALYSLSAHLLIFLFLRSFLAALIPLGFPAPICGGEYYNKPPFNPCQYRTQSAIICSQLTEKQPPYNHFMEKKGDKTQADEVVMSRLKKERKDWRTDHPHNFVAKPAENMDGSTNMLKWVCEIPGPVGTIWEDGTYTLHMDFSHDYPVRPPKCVFKPVLPHPNIYPSGTVCLSILNEEEDWKPFITIKQILLGIQKLIKDEPNLESPAQSEPLNLYKNRREEYIKKVKEFAQGQKKVK